MTDTQEGGCRCGAVRYRVSGEPLMAALCHCRDCRRSTGAPMVAWALYEASQVEFVSRAPATHLASPGVQRGFCARCGTSLSFTADYLPGMIDLTLASFDAPERIAPRFHTWTSQALPWMATQDALPRHREFPPMASAPA